MASLEHRPTKVRDLIHQFHDGTIMVPEFQRDYVWTKRRAAKLIDSLYRDFPIGSLLVWKTDAPVVSRTHTKNTSYWLLPRCVM